MIVRHSNLDHNEQNIIVDQASGGYYVNQISAALRTAYHNRSS